jgi:hypothetical protein
VQIIWQVFQTQEIQISLIHYAKSLFLPIKVLEYRRTTQAGESSIDFFLYQIGFFSIQEILELST